MKILKLRFLNLNSLYGEWNIDFTDSSYQSDGIFAITGPTGSGKTTIMDAICLALYGRTPRLLKISQGTNEIMSRKTGECFSEVLFESSKGRFVCHWSQKRSHLKPDGNLQLPRHEISDADSGKVLESSRNMVSKLVEETTGMDFEQFTRSVMLAQGGFAAFLEADPAERSPILEQITGTEIYSRISVKVHEKTREEKEKLGLLSAGADAIALLNPDEISDLLAEKENKKIRSEELSGTISGYDKCLLWLGRIDELKRENLKLEEEKIQVTEDFEKFSDDSARLERAKKAAGLEGIYQSYNNIRELAEKNKNDYDTKVHEIERLQNIISELSKKSIQADGKLKLIKSKLSEERENIKLVNSLDSKIEGETKNFRESEKRHDRLLDKKKGYEENIKDLKISIEEKSSIIELCFKYLVSHQNDSFIFEDLGTIKEKASFIRETRQKISDKNNRLDGIIAEKINCLSILEKRQKSLEIHKDNCKNAEKEFKEKSDELLKVLNGRETEEIRKEKEELEKVIFGFERILQIFENQTNYINEKEAVLKRNQSLESEQKAADIFLEALLKEISSEERIEHELEEKKVLALKIKSLEEERKNLVDGVPCPLCGSIKHPYSAENTDTISEKDDDIDAQRQKINSLNESILKIKTKKSGLYAEFSQNQKRISEIETEIQKAESKKRVENEKTGMDADECRNEEYYSKTKSELANNVELLQKILISADSCRKNLENAQGIFSKERDNFYNCEKEYTNAKNRFDNLVNEESILSTEISGSTEGLSAEINSLKEILSKFINSSSIEDSEKFTDDTAEILDDLEERKEKYLSNSQEKDKLSRELDILKRDLNAAKTSLKDCEAEIFDAGEQLNKSENTLSNYKNERYHLYGNKNPKEEEKKFEELLLKAESESETIKGEKNSSEGSLKSKLWQKDELETEKTRYSSQLTAKEMVFSMKIEEAGFSDENEFLEALLLKDEINRLESKRDDLINRKNTTEARLSDRKLLLEEEKNKNLTERRMDDILADKTAAEDENRTILREIGAVENRISENEEKKAHLSEKLEKIAAQKIVYERWERLHELIGSADGKKFRNFAQGLTFEIMIANANRQLERMNDRYLLFQSPEKPLELSVIDNYQAGEVRSTKNLSGGESFIVSLALALGLSNMAGRNVRVDSLFLDEGFGTLDDDALETAIETLAGLRQDGKLIGIISHVAAIKERIPTKIEITKKSGGKSVLKGPGCSKKA